jgi:hypothetical protein
MRDEVTVSEDNDAIPLHDALHALHGKHVLTVDLFNRDMVTAAFQCAIFSPILTLSGINV